jgi:acetyl-CoA acetyltransferase
MKLKAIVAGTGMTRFGKHMDKGLKALGGEAATEALADAGVEVSDIEAAWVGNAAAGLITGQECIRGQVILRDIGLGKVPVVNVENACASASTAFNQACAMVSAGLYDVVLALGVEKLYHEDKRVSFAAFNGAVDVEMLAEIRRGMAEGAAQSGAKSASKGAGENRSMFMDFYAAGARRHMETYGTRAEHFAAVSAKNSFHGSLNPRAQFREALTIEEVLSARMIAEPLTLPMCSPIGDGAAAVVVMSERKARERGVTSGVRVLTSSLHSGFDHSGQEGGVTQVCLTEAYEEAGVGPEDVDVIELHDASAPAELMAYESLGLCGAGEGAKLLDEGATKLGGRIPVNTSGGLLRKGHPVGATGIAQIVELTEQIQGRCDERQVPGARLGLAHNGGGTVRGDAAAMCVTILSA